MPRSETRTITIEVPFDDLVDEEVVSRHLNIPARTVAALLDSERMPFVRVVAGNGQKRVHWKGLMMLAWLFESGEIEKVFGNLDEAEPRKNRRQPLRNLGTPKGVTDGGDDGAE